MREVAFKRQQQAAEYDAWFRSEVLAGLDAANAGDIVPADEVEADALVWRDAVRQKPE